MDSAQLEMDVARSEVDAGNLKSNVAGTNSMLASSKWTLPVPGGCRRWQVGAARCRIDAAGAKSTLPSPRPTRRFKMDAAGCRPDIATR